MIKLMIKMTTSIISSTAMMVSMVVTTVNTSEDVLESFIGKTVVALPDSNSLKDWWSDSYLKVQNEHYHLHRH